MKTTAIIVAAGSGSRFNSDTPKQFLELNGKLVIVHTLERFQAAPSVTDIILVLSEDRIEEFDAGVISKLSMIVPGGPTRAKSVANGMDAIIDDSLMVAVHDGARPLITVDEIESTIGKAKQTGAACLVAPVTDTIKSISDGKITETLDRRFLRRALTPQVFKIEILRKAFENADLDESVTDECYLVERLGYPIAIIEGSLHNIKITHREDLILAESLMNGNV